MTFQAIAFDLDGTLVDSAGGVALALNTALHEADLPCFDLQRVRGWIGSGPDVLIERALRAVDLQDIDTAWLSARRAARPHYHRAGRRHRGASHAIAALDRADCEGARNSPGAHADDRGLDWRSPSGSRCRVPCGMGGLGLWAARQWSGRYDLASRHARGPAGSHGAAAASSRWASGGLSVRATKEPARSKCWQRAAGNGRTLSIPVRATGLDRAPALFGGSGGRLWLALFHERPAPYA
jgi:hypothetical protein